MTTMRTDAPPMLTGVPVFLGRSINPEITSWITTHPFLYVYNIKKQEHVLAPGNYRTLRDIDQLLMLLGRIYGYNLTFFSQDKSFSATSMRFSIHYPVNVRSEEYFGEDGDSALIMFVSRGSTYPDFNKKYPELKLSYPDYMYRLFVSSNLHAQISREALGKSSDLLLPGSALYSFKKLDTRWRTVRKKQDLSAKDMPSLMVATEMYSRFATKKNLPLNRITHLANGIKAGMSPEAAVWLAGNNIPSVQAETFSKIPFDWLEALS